MTTKFVPARTINCCELCPEVLSEFVNGDAIYCCTRVINGLTGDKGYYAEVVHNWQTIPEWCPLEDVKEIG